MKKLVYIFTAAAMTLGLAGCTQEKLQPGTAGEEVDVALSVSVPGGATTKAGAYDNLTLEGMNVSVFVKYGTTVLPPITGVTKADGVANITLRLVTGQEYQVAAWAAFDGGNYTVNTDGTVKMKTTAVTGSDTKNDAFFGNGTVTLTTSNQQIELPLKRPFGLLTINTTDWDLATVNDAGLRPDKYVMSLDNVPTTIDLFTGTFPDNTLENVTVTGTIDDKTDGTPKELSFDYIFAGANEQNLNDFTVEYKQGDNKITSYDFTNIPLRRNYKTNLTGNILTKEGSLNIEVKPEFEGERPYPLPDVTTTVGTVTEVKDAISEAVEQGAKSVEIVVTDPVKEEAAAPESNMIIIPEKAPEKVHVKVNFEDENGKVYVGAETATAANEVTVEKTGETNGDLAICASATGVVAQSVIWGDWNKVEYGAADPAVTTAASTRMASPVMKNTVETSPLCTVNGTVGELTVHSGDVIINGAVGEMIFAEGNETSKILEYHVATAETFRYLMTLPIERYEKIILDADIVFTNPNEDKETPNEIKGILDLNGKTLSVTSAYGFTVPEGKSWEIGNGHLNTSLGKGVRGAIIVSKDASLKMNQIEMVTNSCGLYPSGDAAEVLVTNSTIDAKYYAVTTNASTTYSVDILLEDSEFTGNSPILLNIPCTLTMNRCKSNGTMHGVAMRGGTAVLDDCDVTLTYDDENWETMANYFNTKNWESGNTINLAAMTIGNKTKSTAYQYPTNVTLKNTRLKLAGKYGANFPALYAYANQGDGLGVTLNYDDNCIFAKYPEYGSTNITVNGKNVTKGELEARNIFKNGGDLTLQENIDLVGGPLVMNSDKTVTLDLNGKDIVNNMEKFDGKYGDTGIFEVSGTSTLNIKGDGNIKATADDSDRDGYRMAVWAYGNAKVNISGGSYYNSQRVNTQLDLIYADGNAVINISGGTFESNCFNNRGYWVLNMKDKSNATISVTGGTFVNYDPAKSRSENPEADFVADKHNSLKISDEPSPNGTYQVISDKELEALLNSGGTVEIKNDIRFADTPYLTKTTTTLNLAGGQK